MSQNDLLAMFAGVSKDAVSPMLDYWRRKFAARYPVCRQVDYDAPAWVAYTRAVHLMDMPRFARLPTGRGEPVIYYAADDATLDRVLAGIKECGDAPRL